MKVLFLTGSAPADDAAAMDRLAQAATDLQITLVDSPSSALAEIRRVRTFHALMTSPTVPHTDALALIVSLRRDGVPIAIVPIVSDAQQGFYAPAVASGADDILLLRGDQFVNLRETLTRIRQSPHLRQAAERRRLRTLYAGKDPIVWTLLAQIPFVTAERATVSPDGVTPVRTPGDAGSALRCDVVVIDEPQADAHALQILKSVKGQASDLPVIILTAPTAGDVETAALDLGADDIVVKSGVYRRRLVATLRHAHQRLELVEQHTTLRARAERLRQILETMPAGLAIVSGDGTVLAINAAAQALVGAAKPTDVVGRPFVSLAIESHQSDLTQTLREIAAGEASDIVFDVAGIDGAHRTVELHGVVLERDARGTRGVIAVLQPPAPAGDGGANVEDLRAELDEACQALTDAEVRYDELAATLSSERMAALDAQQKRETLARELAAVTAERQRIEADLDTVRRDLQQNADAHAWERTSWENTRRELTAKLNEAQLAASAGAAVHDTVAAVSEDLQRATDALAGERAAWDAERHRLTGRIEALEAAVAAHVVVEAALEAARAELVRTGDAHAEERARWEAARADSARRLSELDAITHERTEIEARLDATRGELRQASEALAAERTRAEETRQELARRFGELEGALADRSQIDGTLAAARDELNRTTARFGEERARFDAEQRQLADALDAARLELRRAAETHGADRAQWDGERRELADRVRELDTVAAGRPEVEVALGTARAELREATNTLAWERANWDTARRHHEHQIRSLEEARAADRAEFDRERHRLQADLNSLAGRVTTSANLGPADAGQRWVLDCGLVGMSTMTLDGRLIRCNDTFGRMFGYLDADDAVARAQGQPFPGTAGREELDAKLLARHQLPYIDSCLERVDGRPLRVVECATLVNDEAGGQTLVERVFVEMNLRSELEERLQQARRLEEVGRLAAAMTPDIDALVSSIHDPGARLSQDAAVPEPARQEADTILARAKRATDLVRQLLRFSRKQSQPPAPIDVNDVVRRVEPVLTRLVGSHVDFEVELESTDAILASEVDLEQLVTTLVVSVRDLLPVGGSLRLETGTGRLDWTNDFGPDVKSGPVITLAVTGAGYGVQPPQTTASLGLLAERCGGSIEVLQHEGRVGLQVHIPYFSRSPRHKLHHEEVKRREGPASAGPAKAG